MFSSIYFDVVCALGSVGDLKSWDMTNFSLQTGRKPSGLCGAALYISALTHGLKFSKSDIVSDACSPCFTLWFDDGV